MTKDSLRTEASTIFSNGQICIPKWVLEALKLKDGDVLDLNLKENGEIVYKIRQNFLLLAWLTMFKPRKMSKMQKFLPCRADFMPPLCYNTSKWGIAARRAPVVLTTQDGSKEYL